MKTYFIGQEEVRAYLRDLLVRLDPLLPSVWCPITESGLQLTKELSTLTAEAVRRRIQVHPITVEGSKVSIPEDSVVHGKDVLLLDSAIHSGRMMTYCASQIVKHAPASLTTYALAVKRCSSFFPTLWGVMTEAGDRPYFLLHTIPNNRLNAGPRRSQPPVHIRLLAEEHVKAAALRSGTASIDRVTWSDRLFQMRTSHGTSTYVLERGATIVGFLTVHVDADRLTVAEVVVDPTHQNNGYGGILLRFAETLARHADCRAIHLNAISDKAPLYEGFGFSRQHADPITLDDETYYPMERLVLYHQGHRHIDGSSALPSDAGISGS